NDVLHDDRLAAVDDADRPRAHGAASAGVDGAEGDLDLAPGGRSVEASAHLVELHAEAPRDQVDRRLPGRPNEARFREVRLEVEGTTATPSVHHHGGPGGWGVE